MNAQRSINFLLRKCDSNSKSLLPLINEHLWETKCSESNFISTHHWHATFRACKTIFHEKLDLRKMHTMMHIQTFWKITGASFKLHDSEYIISWPFHDFSFTLNEKTALKSSENKIKICRYVLNKFGQLSIFSKCK